MRLLTVVAIAALILIYPAFAHDSEDLAEAISCSIFHSLNVAQPSNLTKD